MCGGTPTQPTKLMQVLDSSQDLPQPFLFFPDLAKVTQILTGHSVFSFAVPIRTPNRNAG